MLTKFLDEKDYPSIGTHGCKARCPLDVEVWEDCADVPEVIEKLPELEHGKYFVSSFGRVKRINKNTSKELGIGKCHNGYMEVTLYSKDNRIHFRVHRLVFSAFGIANGYGDAINHIDSDRINNNIKNLEKVTHIENMNNYATRLKLSKGRCYITFADTGEVHKECTSLWEAAKFLCINTSDFYSKAHVNYACFIVKSDYRDMCAYNPYARHMQRYYCIDNNFEKIVSTRYIHNHINTKYNRQAIFNLNNGEDISIYNKKGLYKGVCTIHRLTCKEIWEYIVKDLLTTKRERHKRFGKVSYEYEDTTMLRRTVQSVSFCKFVEKNPQILEDFNRYKASLTANNQVS